MRNGVIEKTLFGVSMDVRLCRSDLSAKAADTHTVPCHGECLRSKCSFTPGRGAGHPP